MATERPGQRRLSDLAREIAEKNRRDVAKQVSSMPPSLRADYAEENSARTDEGQVQKELLKMMVEKNPPRIDEGSRAILTDAKTLADELDTAGFALEKSLQKWVEKSTAAANELRSKRMAITTEINHVAQAVKDATGFLADLNKGDAFATLAKLAEVGAALKKAYGDEGLVRLADALLVLSEQKGGE